MHSSNESKKQNEIHDPQELLHQESLMIVEIKDCQQIGHFALIFHELQHPFTVMVSVLILLCIRITQENNTLHLYSEMLCELLFQYGNALCR